MTDFSHSHASEHARVAPNWGWFVALGVILLVLGFFAFIDTVAVTLVSVVFIGAVLVVGGGFQVAHAFANRDWASFLMGLVCGALYVIGGFLIMAEPLQGSLAITLFLAAALIVGGVLRIVVASAHREVRGWWLLLLGGLIGIAVALAILFSLPWSSLWLLGTLIAIELVVQGVAWLRVGFALRDMR
jgi:uncharacterized membrane protein HdeD (DUF308 family)